MNKTFFGIIATFVLVGSFLVYQSTRQESSLVLLPSELLVADKSVYARRVRVGGRIAALPIAYEIEPRIELRFSIHDPKGSEQVVPVVYNGLKPDMFAPGRDVIIDGEFDGSTLRASSLLTQCPSKYEPPDPETKEYL